MARNRAVTELIVLHASKTHKRQDIGVRTLNKRHMEAGIYSDRGLSGYHFVVRRSGYLELGRDLPSVGQHLLGYNKYSVGVCLIGGADIKGEPENNFVVEQEWGLEYLLQFLHRVYPEALVVPHSRISGRSDCPVWPHYPTWHRAHVGPYDERRIESLLERIAARNLLQHGGS